MSGCATDKAALLADAAIGKAGADAAALSRQAADAAIADARRMPDLPAECRRHWGSGIVLADKLDTAAIKADQALGGANRQIDGCAAWYDRNKAAREPRR